MRRQPAGVPGSMMMSRPDVSFHALSTIFASDRRRDLVEHIGEGDQVGRLQIRQRRRDVGGDPGGDRQHRPRGEALADPARLRARLHEHRALDPGPAIARRPQRGARAGADVEQRSRMEAG